MQQNSGLLKDNVQVQNREGKSTGNLNQVHLEKIGLAYKMETATTISWPNCGSQHPQSKTTGLC